MKKLALFIFVLSLFACKKEFNEDETRFLRDFSAEIENVSLSKFFTNTFIGFSKPFIK
jgi:hypothetical protein